MAVLYIEHCVNQLAGTHDMCHHYSSAFYYTNASAVQGKAPSYMAPHTTLVSCIQSRHNRTHHHQGKAIMCQYVQWSSHSGQSVKKTLMLFTAEELWECTVHRHTGTDSVVTSGTGHARPPRCDRPLNCTQQITFL